MNLQRPDSEVGENSPPSVSSSAISILAELERNVTVVLINICRVLTKGHRSLSVFYMIGVTRNPK